MSVQDQPGNLSSPAGSAITVAHEVAGLGLALSLAGRLFHARLGRSCCRCRTATAPAFLVFAAGVAFLFAGLLCFIRARTGMTDNQSNAARRPRRRWIKLSPTRRSASAVLGAFATIGTWVAIGSGPAPSSVSSPLGTMQTTGDMLGRTIVRARRRDRLDRRDRASPVSTVRKLSQPRL